jgi:hypothetical protein
VPRYLHGDHVKWEGDEYILLDRAPAPPGVRSWWLQHARTGAIGRAALESELRPMRMEESMPYLETFYKGD